MNTKQGTENNKYYIEYLNRMYPQRDRETIITAPTARAAVNTLRSRGDCSRIMDVIDITGGDDDWVAVKRSQWVNIG